VIDTRSDGQRWLDEQVDELRRYRKRERSRLTKDELIVWLNQVMADLDAVALGKLSDYAERLRRDRTEREE